jgi:hypothetical protein
MLSLILMPGILAAQKLDGVFVGELITAKNALVLTTKGDKVNGSVYLTEYEKFTFMGNLSGDSLKGVILVPGGEEVVVMGRRFADSICATLHSNENPRRVTLHQISAKANHNLGRYFGEGTAERDALMVGKWYLVKSLMPDGSEYSRRKYFYDYQADGIMNLDIASLKANLEEGWRKAGGKGKLKFDESMLPRNTWRTSGKTLITTSVSSAAGTAEHEYTYLIKDDTLTIVNFKGGREIMVRERKKN